MADTSDLIGSLTGLQEKDPAPSASVEQSEAKRKLVTRVEREVAMALPRVMGFRGEASISEKDYDGHQWDELDRMRLEQLRRPTIVFNEVKPTINAISGIERLNRPDIRFVSRPLDSSLEEDAAGDLLTQAFSHVIDLCDGDAEQSRAVRDMSITGMGWVELRMDYEEDPDGRIVIERIPWREMLWDVNSRKENLADARWVARKREVPHEEFKRRWPKFSELVDTGSAYYEEQNVEKYELVTPYYSRQNEEANPQVKNQGAKRTMPVTQYQWRDTEPVYRFLDQGEMTDMPEKDWNKFKERAELLGMQVPYAVRQLRTVYKEVYIASGVVLQGPTDLPGGFSLKAITGEWDDEKKLWYGIERALRDPQRTMNKSLSTGLTMFLTNAKGGVMYETGAFTDPVLAKNQWSKPDAWIEMTQGGAAKVVQREPFKYQGPLDVFFTESKAAFNYVSGIPPDMLGIAVNDVTAPTIQKRVQAALAVLGWFFDNITRFRKAVARTAAEYIREYWTHGQLVRIGGDFNSQAIPLLKSNLPIQYDMILDESVRHNPNLKAQLWMDLQPILPALLKAGMGRIVLQALKYSPIPAQMLADIQREAAEMAKNPPQDKKPKEDPQLVAAKVQKTLAEAQRTAAETKAIEVGAQHRVAETVLDALFRQEEIDQGAASAEDAMIGTVLDGLLGFMSTVENSRTKEKEIQIKHEMVGAKKREKKD
jgi:hypothetical protein